MNAAEIIITLDGPAGSGKSTTAREVAHRLGYRHLDSGALYRAVTHALLGAGLEPDSWNEISGNDLDSLGLSVDPVGDRIEIYLLGHLLEAELRSEQVTAQVSSLASLATVRHWLLEAQREAGREGRLVADGRDMGTVVFPDAALKVFLIADLDERARRRLVQSGQSPASADVAQEAIRLRERDRRDEEREHSPLVVPEGALVLDTTDLDFQTQVAVIVAQARALTL